jgi:predicted transcriptional regulator
MKRKNNHRLISRNEAAELLGCTSQTISNYLNNGSLKGHVRQGRLYIDRTTIEQYMDVFKDTEALEGKRRELSDLHKMIDKEIDEFRRTLRYATAVSGKVNVSKFLESLCEFVDVAGIYTQREQDVIFNIIKGRDISYIADKYGLTHQRIIQIIAKVVRKTGHLKRITNELLMLRKENAELKKAYSDLKTTVSILENKAPEDVIEANAPLVALLNTPITDLDLSVRALNCMKYAEISTLGELVKHNKSELLRYRNFGRKSLTEIEELLQQFGLRLGMIKE